MAHLWVSDAHDEWGVLALDEDVLVLDATGPRRSPRDLADPPSSDILVLRRCGVGAAASWAILAGPDADALVNGAAIPQGMAVLADRDEIRLPLAPPMYFSTEILARPQ
jgi:hypothetical protein